MTVVSEKQEVVIEEKDNTILAESEHGFEMINTTSVKSKPEVKKIQ